MVFALKFWVIVDIISNTFYQSKGCLASTAIAISTAKRTVEVIVSLNFINILKARQAIASVAAQFTIWAPVVSEVREDMLTSLGEIIRIDDTVTIHYEITAYVGVSLLFWYLCRTMLKFRRRKMFHTRMARKYGNALAAFR